MINSLHWFQLLAKSDDELIRLSRVDSFRGSGRGGQKRNKTSNAVRLTLEHLSVYESSSRSKTDNQNKALEKLKLAIALDLSQLGTLRCGSKELPVAMKAYASGGLIRINPKNQEFARFLGYFLDLFIFYRGDWEQVAACYEVSKSQLRKFTQKHRILLEKIQMVLENLPDEGGPMNQ